MCYIFNDIYLLIYSIIFVSILNLNIFDYY